MLASLDISPSAHFCCFTLKGFAMVPFVYITLCLLLAYFGRRRRMGFWGMFFGSIVVTPVIGLLIILVTDDEKPAP